MPRRVASSILQLRGWKIGFYSLRNIEDLILRVLKFVVSVAQVKNRSTPTNTILLYNTKTQNLLYKSHNHKYCFLLNTVAF